MNGDTAAQALGELAARMVPVACDLALLVRDAGREEIGRFLAARTEEEIRALLVVLAAMVPADEASAADLLAWVTFDEYGRPLPPERPRWGAGKTRPCGTSAAYERHLRRGEDVDEACREAARKAWKDRRDRRRKTGVAA